MTGRSVCRILAAALLALPLLRLDRVVRACSPALKETISVSSLPTGLRIDVFGVTPFLVNTSSAAVEISVAHVLEPHRQFAALHGHLGLDGEDVAGLEGRRGIADVVDFHAHTVAEAPGSG